MSSDRRLVKENPAPQKRLDAVFIELQWSLFFVYKENFHVVSIPTSFPRGFCFINFRLGHWNPLCFFLFQGMKSFDFTFPRDFQSSKLDEATEAFELCHKAATSIFKLQVGHPGKGIQEGQMKPDEAQGWNPVRLPGDPIFHWLDGLFFLQNLHFFLEWNSSFSQGQCKLQRHSFGQNDVGFLAPGVDLLFAGKKDLFPPWGDQLWKQ